jgi:hypothetical protein
MVRGLAMNYWGQGADGIYTFNWSAHQYVQHPENHPQSAYMMEPLREIDDPEAMRGKDRLFAADRGVPKWTYPHNWMHCILPAALEAGDGAQVPILVGEDLTRPPAPRRVELRVGLKGLTDAGAVQVTLNGQPLPDLKRADPGSVRAIACRPEYKAPMITCSLKPRQVIAGRNQVGIVVSEGKIEVMVIEILVSY